MRSITVKWVVIFLVIFCLSSMPIEAKANSSSGASALLKRPNENLLSNRNPSAGGRDTLTDLSVMIFVIVITTNTALAVYSSIKCKYRKNTVYYTNHYEIQSKVESDNDRDFLKTLYGRYAELFVENEDIGEKRVTILVSLVAAIISISGILSAPALQDTEHVPFLLGLSALTGLLLFGLVTFRRIIQRNIITDDYKVKLDKIHLFLLGNNPRFEDITFKTPPKSRVKAFPIIEKGGYLETVQLLNSLLSGLICGLISLTYSQVNLTTTPLIFLISFTGAIGIWFIQFFWANICYLKEEQKKERSGDLKKSNTTERIT
jgi:hypothetical protein